MKFPRRGEMYWVNLDPVVGVEIKKTRPAVILSPDAANKKSRLLIVAPLTSQVTRIFSFEAELICAGKKSKVMLNQIRAIDKQRLGKIVGTCSPEEMVRIDQALKIALSLV